jgi:hypothetical protein
LLLFLRSQHDLELVSVHTLAQAKLDLANEEATKRKDGVIARHEMSPTNFILAVFDIEENMYVSVFLVGIPGS